MGKNSRRNRKKKESQAGALLAPTGKADARDAWEVQPSTARAEALRQLGATWAGVLDEDVVGMIFEENNSELQSAHQALCEISGAPRPLLALQEACADRTRDEGEAEQLQQMLPQVREIFSELSQSQLEAALRDCRFDLEATITVLSSHTPEPAPAAVPAAQQQQRPQDSNNPFEVLEREPDPSGASVVDPAAVRQLSELFGISAAEAELQIARAGDSEAAIEALLREAESAPPEQPEQPEQPEPQLSEQEQVSSVAMLGNMFPALGAQACAEALVEHHWDFDSACSAVLNAQAEQEAAAVSDISGAAQPREDPIEEQPQEQPQEQPEGAQGGAPDAVLDSMVTGLCELFRDIPAPEAARLIQQAEYHMERAVELAILFLSQQAPPKPASPVSIPRAAEEPSSAKLSLSASRELLGASDRGSRLTEKDKMRAALQFGKLVGEADAEGIEDVLLELLAKCEYNITRAFESWLDLEDQKMAAQLHQEEHLAAEVLNCGVSRLDDESLMTHRNWWPQQTFPEEPPVPSPKRDALIELFELFPQEAHPELQHVFEASNRNLEQSIDMVLALLCRGSSQPPPVLDPVSEMELVLVGWSTPQVECLLEAHDGDVTAALDAALSGAGGPEPGSASSEPHNQDPDQLQFLQNIFVDLAPERIAAVLSRNRGEVQSSLNDLLLVASQAGGVDQDDASTAAFGIELAHKSILAKRKMEELAGRFPGIPEDVVEAVFSFNKFQLAKTIEDLEGLGGGLLGDDPGAAEDEDGFKTIRKKPRAPKPKPAGGHIRKLPTGAASAQDEQEWEHSQSQTAQLRRLAMKAGMARGKLLRAATEAYHSGQKALAKELSEQGKEQEALMRQYHREACNAIFLQKNPDIAQLEQIDLHGLTVNEALETTANYLNLCKSMKHRGILKIITGKGIHSEGGVPKIKPAIEDWLQSHRLNFLSSTNGGVVEVAMTAKDWRSPLL